MAELIRENRRTLRNIQIPVIKEGVMFVSKYECGVIDLFLGTTDKNKVDELKEIALNYLKDYPNVFSTNPYDFRKETKLDGKLWYIDEYGFNIFTQTEFEQEWGLVVSENHTNFELAIWFYGEIEDFDPEKMGKCEDIRINYA